MNVAESTDVAALLPLPHRLRAWATNAPDSPALSYKQLGVWRDVSWSEYWDTVQDVAHALLAHGVESGDRVAIHSENRPEWVYLDLAIASIRATTVGVYPTNPSAEVAYLLRDSQSALLIAEDQEQVDKFLAADADDVAEVRHVVYLESRGMTTYTDPRLVSWQEFLERGNAHRRQHPSAVADCMAQVSANDVATLIYTSGTTGPPKGAMLTVANVDFAVRRVQQGGFTDPAPNPRDVILSYLPLCHIMERLVTVYFNLAGGPVVHFAESIDTVQRDLVDVQPSIFVGVPRIWEKLKSGIDIKATGSSRIKRAAILMASTLATRVGARLAEHNGRHTLGTRVIQVLGDLLVLRAVRDRIGLSRCRDAISGAAPISPEILKWFVGLGVPIREAYGMTENCGVATINRPSRVAVGTVGEPHEGIDFRIDDSTGEICMRHPGVFAGYWNNVEATAAAIDRDGWLHTGDVGQWVSGRHVRIVDRLKDIIITAGGKNISPSEIENELKCSPLIKEAVVIGEGRPYLTALIGIDLDNAGEWAQQLGVDYTTYQDLSRRPQLLEHIQAHVQRTNERFARVEHVRKFRMFPKELDHDDGELTATQKVKRASIGESFGDLIDDMYGNTQVFAGGDLTRVHVGKDASTLAVASPATPGTGGV